MTTEIQSFRNNLCVSLIVAGLTDANQIISQATALEEFILGNPEKKVTVTIAQSIPLTTQATPETTQDTVQSEQARDEVADAEITEHEITEHEIKNALMAVAKKSRNALYAILKQFNASKVSDLQTSDYPNIMQAADQALGA